MSQVTHVTVRPTTTHLVVKADKTTVIRGADAAHVVTKVAVGMPGPAGVVRAADPPLDKSLLWVPTIP